MYNKNGRIGIYTRQEREAIIARFKRKRGRRVWKKKIRYACIQAVHLPYSSTPTVQLHLLYSSTTSAVRSIYESTSYEVMRCVCVCVFL